MEYCGISTHRLPDMTMYGGDTTPWIITLVNDDGSKLSASDEAEFECILSVTPFAQTYGVGSYANIIAPVLNKSVTAYRAGDGSHMATFTFIMEDTIHLRGKYTYQIEVRSGINNRVSQGTLTILENKNRRAGW